MTKTDQDRVDFEASEGFHPLKGPARWNEEGAPYCDPLLRDRWRVWQSALAHERARAQGEPVAVPAKELYPAHPGALRASIAELDMWLDSSDALDEIENQQSFGESIMLVVHELKRLQAALVAAPVAPPAETEPVAVPDTMTADKAWQDLCEKDDRTSIDYPGFALIRQDELATYMLAAAPVAPPAESEPVAVPAGWKLVPVEPTEEILDAYWRQTGESREMRSRVHERARHYWQAQLAVPLAPPAESGEVERLPIFGGDGIGTRLSSAMEAYLADYVFGLEDGPDHDPSDFERAMLEDFLNGALSDAAVNDILQEAARALASHTTAPPPESGETLGRFGHHPDPAVDFCLEVEVIQGEAENHRLGFTAGTPSRDEMAARIERAMAFRAGGDVGAVAAKQTLRKIEADFKTPVPPPEPAKAESGEAERLRTALKLVRGIIVDAAMTGFNCHDGDWAQRLFESQGTTARALARTPAPPPGPKPVRWGWYCPHCQRGVDGSEVTFHEQHLACGTYIGDAEPPPPEPAKVEVVDHRKLLEKAVSALDYFADAVFNDNGDMSVTGASFDPDKHILAYQVRRRILSALATPPAAPAAARSAAEERDRLGRLVENLTRPIPCIDGMTAYEVFEAMEDRIARALPLPGEEA